MGFRFTHTSLSTMFSLRFSRTMGQCPEKLHNIHISQYFKRFPRGNLNTKILLHFYTQIFLT